MSNHTAMIEENLDQREGQPEPNSAGGTGGGAVLGVTPCSACGNLKQPVMIGGINTGCWSCDPCNKKLPEAWAAVKKRALECLSDFEAETSVTIKLAMEDQRQWAFAKTDDDGTPVFIWNHLRDDGEWEVREVWLNAEITNVLREFLSLPNVTVHPIIMSGWRLELGDELDRS